MEHLGALLLGIGNGGVYAALALALVLTYRSSGVINFATGAVALFGAYTYSGLRQGELYIFVPGLPGSLDFGTDVGLVPSVLLALGMSALLGALLYAIVFRPLREAPALARAVASLGVLVVLQELMALRRGLNPVRVDDIFPAERWRLGSLSVYSDRFFLAVSVVVLTVLLWAIFRYTRFGLLTRAAAESQTGAYVSGVSPDRIALLNWMISSAIAGAVGVLIAPIAPISPPAYTLFVVPALGASLVGGFQHLLPTLVAGLGIGMLQGEAGKLAGQHSWLPQSGSPELIALIVILVALLLTSEAMPARGGLLRHPLGRAPRPRSILAMTVVGSGLGVAALLLTDGSWRSAVIGSFIAGIIGLSLVVVTGYCGQVSAAQMALAGAGAYTLSGLTMSWHVPFPIAPLLAACFCAGLGVLIGLPALRLRGLTLGVVSLGFAYAIEAAWFRNTQIVDTRGASVRSPTLFGIDLSIGSGLSFPRISFGLLCLTCLVAVAAGVARLRTSSLGSAMLAVRANERSAAGLGVNVLRVKVTSFAIGSFIAGLGGSLFAYRRGTVSFDSFATIQNLTLLSSAYLAGVTSVFGGILAGLMAGGGLLFVALDTWVELGQWFGVVTGVALIINVITNPEGIAAGFHLIAQRIPVPAPRRRHRRERRPTTTMPATVPADEPLLRVRDLTVRYGNVLAVDNLSLDVNPGTVVGLIGPNGAGKTSAIDAITGFARASGAVSIGEVDVGALPPHVRVRRGLSRTFQSIELYDDLSVEENVSVAAFAGHSGDPDDAVTRALDRVGIADLRNRAAGELSQGQRQLVSVARACAAEPRVLLLDEPAAGLDSTESQWLGDRIRGIADAGTAVLLVDHDVALVFNLCDYIYVLDFGRVIAEGSGDAIRTDPIVAEAYLGQSPVAVDTSEAAQ
jgi:ABC-type branched-subunit amino acid transport system ATPase component/branched-subunit amino acid ABC-type transport system permease component